MRNPFSPPHVEDRLTLSVLKILAISGTSGSSGLGSQSSEQIESNTFEMVSAGDHCDLSMSRQIEPFELMFGWYMRVVNATCGEEEDIYYNYYHPVHHT